MLSRAWNRFNYWLERRFVRGAQYRLLIVAALIGLISIVGGAVVLALGTGHDDLGEAVWWAFLRLSDPGYLGDDVGTVNRTSPLGPALKPTMLLSARAAASNFRSAPKS